ncbi:DUF3906 family protein [Paenibacillus sp. N1-5-1-14]|uniref:DUF3906 family protein n=1 Tax=Paenibacillus radicibacter TaxID=2972488 RepID=UPI0021593ADB|nr:DUF3906 family protein [Paenibacillus radicibacter]MCR8643887.1 DUF3906 family protein [Paenibacillus radicibacter]
MFMYKMEIELSDQLVYLIVVADSDEKAFDYAESNLAKHFIATPEVKQLSMIEKKRLDKGNGYIIETGKL